MLRKAGSSGGPIGRTAGCPVGGEKVLQKVVAADAEEIDVFGEPVDEQGGRGNFDHHAQLDLFRWGSRRPQLRRRRGQEGLYGQISSTPDTIGS